MTTEQYNAAFIRGVEKRAFVLGLAKTVLPFALTSLGRMKLMSKLAPKAVSTLAKPAIAGGGIKQTATRLGARAVGAIDSIGNNAIGGMALDTAASMPLQSAVDAYIPGN